ncbi:Rop family plasmid primer RNA-binding protein, partial [Salmonella enterica]|uniref:Rop family plasmid primer RNA-binding protein n=1 Tax=Salmonella enterica TaxID=28901 RepID=UPI003D80ABC7
THMNRQESAVLNIANFIRAQTLLLLESIDLLDFDDVATDCDQLLEQAEALFRKLSARLESDISA